MKTGYDYGSMQRGGDMYPWQQGGTVSFGSINGPSGGQAVSERASAYPMRNMQNGGTVGTGILTIPVIVALGVLVWYALKQYD